MATGGATMDDDTTGTEVAGGVMVAMECIVGPVCKVKTEAELGVPNRRALELVLQQDLKQQLGLHEDRPSSWLTCQL